MQILSHRGYWKSTEEKNSEIAFRRSFECGWGVETDIRDFNGELVISHDLPDSNSLRFDAFLELHRSYGSPGCLALNIKSDGLQSLLVEKMQSQPQISYFVFDMSIPDALGYGRAQVPYFSRVSEYENLESLFVQQSRGVWVDIFHSEWPTNNFVGELLKTGQKVALVSPELHRRPGYMEYWSRFLEFKASENLLICTDFPDKAGSFFGV